MREITGIYQIGNSKRAVQLLVETTIFCSTNCQKKELKFRQVVTLER